MFGGFERVYFTIVSVYKVETKRGYAEIGERLAPTSELKVLCFGYVVLTNIKLTGYRLGFQRPRHGSVAAKHAAKPPPNNSTCSGSVLHTE